MEPDRRCGKCGQAIPWGEPECPLCSERPGYFWLQRRDTFLILVFVFIVLQFVITGYAVRRYHGVERGLAQGWLRIPGQGGHDSEIDSVSIPKLIRSRFRDEAGHGFRF